ncbi:hypothetical protein [Nocardioides piscis]|uniref:Sulfotransferase family protein n=1 Tax=Nocardioides piscis TaxID=2714938 RepID=A0A6G7YFR4_9ACTN|nr:hypothetical protein [Nocardioides piscis]QIK75633.1 hypothetical protein G7071_09425 [Nocardioides piscis]
MSPRLVLHVGVMKSGTSFVQSRLFANKRLLLEERGILVPGLNWLSQVMAARDVLGSGDAQWAKMAGKVHAHEGTSVISMEYLGPARPVVVRRVLDTFPDHQVDVVVTARDLNRSIAAMWQETVQNGRTWTFADYLAGIEEWRPGHRDESRDAPESGRTFWRQQNLVRIARTWGEEVGAPVTLVTVPPPGAPRELLWERFCSVLGTSPDGFAPARLDNESVGAASTLVIRRLNELLDEAGLPFPEGTDLRKGVLAKQVLAARKSVEPSTGLPVAPWVRDHADHMVTALQDLDVALVGAWNDLTPVDVPGVDPATIDASLVADAAIAGLAGLLAEQIRTDG